jgi:hypothetical protein
LITAPARRRRPRTGDRKTGTPTAQTAGSAFSVTVQAVDANWNPVSSADTAASTSSDPTTRRCRPTPPRRRTRTFVACTLKTADHGRSTAHRRSPTGPRHANSSTITVNAGAFAKLLITAPGETRGARNGDRQDRHAHGADCGSAFSVTVQAVDANWNPVSSARHRQHHVE